MSAFSFSLPRLLGIPLRVHVLLPLLLVGLLLGLGFTRGWLAATSALCLVLVGLGSLLLHEFAHAYVARARGVPVHEIFLGPLVNMARLARFPENPADEARIAAAGPAINLALVLVLLALRPLAALAGPLHALLEAGLWINLAMFVGNLLPAFPMDGGRILRSLLARGRPLVIATEMTVKTSRCAVLLLPLLLLLEPRLRHPGAIVVLAFVGLYLWRASGRERSASLAREVRLQKQHRDPGFPDDIEAELDAHPSPSLGSFRPLPPHQFRFWRKNCESAFRIETGLYGRAGEDPPERRGEPEEPHGATEQSSHPV